MFEIDNVIFLFLITFIKKNVLLTIVHFVKCAACNAMFAGILKSNFGTKSIHFGHCAWKVPPLPHPTLIEAVKSCFRPNPKLRHFL